MTAIWAAVTLSNVAMSALNEVLKVSTAEVLVKSSVIATVSDAVKVPGMSAGIHNVDDPVHAVPPPLAAVVRV